MTKERTMPVWDKFLTERDKAVFSASGYGVRQGFGKRPALLVIDVSYGFYGRQARADPRVDQALAELLRRRCMGRDRRDQVTGRHIRTKNFR